MNPVDENTVMNVLYRVHFPCRKKKCNCDKVIEDAVEYIKTNVWRKENDHADTD